MADFQTQVNINPAPAVEGDFASANPRVVALAGPGGLVAGSNIPSGLVQAGVLVGRFAWGTPGSSVNPVSGEVDGLVQLNSNGAGSPVGIVHRAQQALITVFLQKATQLVPVGLPVIAFIEGDFWMVNASTSTSSIGQTIYAINATGQAWPAAAGSPPTDATLTTITVVANAVSTGSVALNTFSGYISGTTLTVTTVTTGGMFPNQTLTGTNIAAGTSIIRQLTGTAGAAGTYLVNIFQNVASSASPVAITGSGAWMNITAVTTGVFLVGMTMSGGTNAFTAGATIVAGGTGTGGTGTYPVIGQATSLANIANATGNGAYMNVTAVTGSINVGDSITTGTTHVSTVLSQVSGTPKGIGAYWISNAAAIGDVSGTAYAGTATKFLCMSVAAPGELMKVSSWPQG